MQFTRRNVWDLGKDWADPILWYARGVAGMKARKLAEPTSWRFYGAIHGMDEQLWQQLGYLSSSDVKPSNADVDRFWDQCQHGSWYFLPWHRGYLFAFEANIRAIVTKLGGPADWALPYWNYFKPNEAALPPAFASPDWPDGKGNNPLFVTARYGPGHDGKVFVPLNSVNLKAMTDPDFTGVAFGSPGFGGVDTGFSHHGNRHGAIESQPHDVVHGFVGGANPQGTLPGLMSDPDTAGLDPIFWLHHANIDRLWEVWRRNPPSDVDPTDANWIKGPANVGDRIFSMPMPDGSTWDYVPGDVTSLAKLDYTYDDFSPAVPAAHPGQRLLRLGASPEAVSALQGAPAVPSPKNVELMGANAEPIPITGAQASTSVKLDTGVRRKVAASLSAPSRAPGAVPAVPDRIFLNLENVRGLADSTTFDVYVGLPKDADPADHPERLAGTIGLFGVRKASAADGKAAGQGLNYTLEITSIVDALHLENSLDVGELDVRIVPVTPVHAASNITIGRISIYRQGH